MNAILAVLLLVGGLLILWKSAELLVSGAVRLAERLGVTPLVIGLTVVAMGTSAPEVAASIAGVLQEKAGGDIAIGNVFGSNIANLALVGGLVALIRPLRIKKKTLKREIPVMLGVGIFLCFFVRDSIVSRIDAGVLLAVFAGLLLLMGYLARREGFEPIQAEYKADTISDGLLKCLIYITIGLAGLALGAKMTVTGAVDIGRKVGLSEGVIALTVIAFGTSLPELVTCVVAALKKQDEISIGNLVGSNIFNTLLVTGTAGIVKPFEISASFAGGADYWIMISISVAFAVIAILCRRAIGKIGGSVLLCSYLIYLCYCFLTRIN
ncbi:MAG: calcium/sodium antiporter [Planctomycetota bacterium]|jgi:cation:H+ antiporter